MNIKKADKGKHYSRYGYSEKNHRIDHGDQFCDTNYHNPLQESYIKNPTDFVCFIENLTLPDNPIIATLDVCSL